MSSRALERLGEETGAAASGVLEAYAPGSVQVGAASVLPEDSDPLSALDFPVVIASVSYVDGARGGNVCVMPIPAARKLAAAMMGTEPDDSAELGELEISAVSEAMNQMMAAAAGATTRLLGSEVDISPPDTRLVSSAEELPELEQAPSTVSVPLNLMGEPCRLLQLVPTAFTLKIQRAIDELDGGVQANGHGADSEAIAASLGGITMRVAAELGRVRMPAAQVVSLPAGAVVELDRQVDDPIDIYVNGQLFAHGTLVVADESDWAVRIDELVCTGGPLPGPAEGEAGETDAETDIEAEPVAVGAAGGEEPEDDPTTEGEGT
jgi:flagellar motor switch protein FliN/FliY